MSIKHLVSAVAVTAVALTACSSPAPTPETGTPAGGGSPAASVPAGPLASLNGVLRIGTEGTYAPFTFHDPTTNELTGYDIEVITAVAEKLGLKPEFFEVKWDGIFAGLDSGRYDTIANEVSTNDERRERYELTAPFSVSYPVAIVKADNTAITDIASLKGKTTAQTATSNWADYAREYGATVEAVDGFVESVAVVKDGRVDFTLNDNLSALDYFSTTKDDTVKIAFDIKDRPVTQVFPFVKGSGLAAEVDKALAEIGADGTLAAIGVKYFGQDISK
ncbi:MAG: transporter substrate-binding domain-containing protein [Propionibacteriaceae bacterium]|jgi:ABC-type amino acid transport substrate-binding protein|nr:transporter substrate-binding domain-containing protein [Propionibacteriaceae bacterium]